MDPTSPEGTEAQHAASEPDFYGKWQPIKTAPKDGTTILLGFVPIGNLREWDRRVYEGKWNETQKTFTSVNGFLVLSDASHWMPLPPPPKE